MSRGTPSTPAGPPANTTVKERASYLPDGRVETALRGDGGTTKASYPVTSRMKSLNMSSLAEGARVTTLESYNTDNIATKLKDGRLRSIEPFVVPDDRSQVPEFGFSSDGVKTGVKLDDFGRTLQAFGGGTARADTTLTLEYGKDALGTEGRGFPTGAAQGVVSETYGYDDDRGNVNHVETPYGVKHDIEYDEWDRPIREVLGQSTGAIAPVKEVVRRAFDEAGRLSVEIRSQRQPDGSTVDVRSEYGYNDRDQIVSVRRNQVAGADPGSLAGAFAETKLRYDTSTGFLREVESPTGLVTTYTFDRAGRLASVTPPGSATRTFGYDEVGRPTFVSDGTSTWGGVYDEWGGLTNEALPGGAAVNRTFDDAGGVAGVSLADRATGEVLAKVEGVDVTSFGETASLTQVQDAANTRKLLVSRSFDAVGRLVEQKSAGRTDVKLDYEKGSGRVLAVSDSARQLGFTYNGDTPWADRLSFGEAPTGSASFLPTISSDVTHDAYGRVTSENRSDGTFAAYVFDETGRPIASTDGASSSRFGWDSRGRILKAERPGPQGATTYGYDLDGRLRIKHTVAGDAGQVFDTGYDYEPGTGRLRTVSRPDGASETYSYYPDDTLATVDRSDGAKLKYTYDDAKRIRKRVAAGGSAVAGGETFTWDAASRMTGADRLKPNGVDVDAAAAVVPGDYDLVGRPHSEVVGARPVLTRDYDLLGGVTSLGLPLGVGAARAFGYTRTFEPLTHRLASITGAGDAPPAGGVGPALLGASWAWIGDDRILGVTSNGPLHLAHRFGYVGGPGGPDGSAPGAAKWKLGTLTVGTDPGAKNLLPFGDAGAPGSAPWGQFSYGYNSGITGDGTKLGRRVTGVGLAGLLAGSLLSNLGFAYGLDNAKRLTAAYAGPGSVTGADAAAAIAAFERFKYEYGPADQLTKETREVEGRSVGYDTGGDGRPDARTIDPDLATPGIKSLFAYDGLRRRIADDRFTFTWHYDGRIATAVVKDCWPIEHGESQGPACPAGYTRPAEAGHELVFAYDALSRLLTRTHLGEIPSGGTGGRQALHRDARIPLRRQHPAGRGRESKGRRHPLEEDVRPGRRTPRPRPSPRRDLRRRPEPRLGSSLRLHPRRAGDGPGAGRRSQRPDPPLHPDPLPLQPLRQRPRRDGTGAAKGGATSSDSTASRTPAGTTKTQTTSGTLPGGIRLSFGIDVDPNDLRRDSLRKKRDGRHLGCADGR